jgi:hypothetical protein
MPANAKVIDDRQVRVKHTASKKRPENQENTLRDTDNPDRTGKSTMKSFSPLSAIRHAGQLLRAAMLALAAAFLFGGTAAASNRVALVIGNSNYQHAGQLANPANDASDMAQALSELGFKVVTGVDLDNRGMRDKIREFAAELRGADVAMLFYAGHAVQVNGRNYLAPVDTKLEFESDVDFETIPLEFIQRQMEREVDTILLFLDACRDNPITRSLKVASRSGGAGKGLAEEKLAAAGTFIAFSTDPGNVALDGKGRNSPFAQALVENIKRPGVEISTMMTDVRVQVRTETNEQQTPWVNSSLLGHFYFNPAPAAAAAGSQQVASTGAAPAPQTIVSEGAKVEQARVAALAWESVKDSNNVEALEYFLASYGDTFYAGLAQMRIQELKGKQGTATAEAQKPTDPATATAGTAAADPATAVVAAEAKPEGDTKVASLDTQEQTRSAEPIADPREVALGIQKELARLGCPVGKPDGLWGAKSQRALESLAGSAKLQLASVTPAPELLDQLRQHQGPGCPVTCSAREVFKNGQCVAKVCPAGQLLSRKGTCFTPKVREAVVERQRTIRQQQPIDQGQVVIQQQPQQPVIVHQQPPVIVEQPRGPSGLEIGVGIGLACIVVGC